MPSPTARYNARLGLVLFFVYLLLYLGFVLISALAADWLERVVWQGLNLAIVYGFGLIAAAFFLALVYGALCRNPDAPEDAS